MLMLYSGGMKKTPIPVELEPEQRQVLESWCRGHNMPHKLALRADIILRAADGIPHRRIAQELRTSRPTVIHWCHAFRRHGVDGLQDIERSGRPPRLGEEKIQQVIAATLKKPENATHWSTRQLAAQMGVSHMTIHRIWRAVDLKPHRTETFKYSRDKRLEAKVIDIVGLYLHPPEKALVLSVDEKSQIQALDRTQPLLPLRPGQVERHTHDYVRNGTTCLFAALNVATGEVIGDCHTRHRHQEFLKFLRRLDEETPPDVDLHLILDNYSTHKHEKVAKWLNRHRRFHLHFTPTGASWMNQIEIWFGIMTSRRIRRGVFKSVEELVIAIQRYIEANNQNPRPFAWTKSVNDILAKARLCKEISVTRH